MPGAGDGKTVVVGEEFVFGGRCNRLCRYGFAYFLFFRRFYPQLIIKAVWPYRGYLPPDVDDATLRYCIEQVNQMQYAAEEYGSGCVAKRNCYLLESNSYGIVYSPLSHGPVAQTLANACCRGVPACNLAKWLD